LAADDGDCLPGDRQSSLAGADDPDTLLHAEVLLQ
jgi:hypothetical protein